VENEFVLDSSAVIALLRQEPGADVVAARLSGASISVVNAAEVGENFARLAGTRDDIERALKGLDIMIEPADLGLVVEVAAMWPITRRAGLSLGDRFCLALAKRSGRPALTGDRRWRDVAGDVGVEVELIR
jgi:ribonuclease VapC